MANKPVVAGQVHPKMPATGKGVVKRTPPMPKLSRGPNPAIPRLGK
jgi:hypothetical protein